jgi:hypothetical protein
VALNPGEKKEALTLCWDACALGNKSGGQNFGVMNLK